MVFSFFLDCRFRGSENYQVPPHPAEPLAQPASPAGGEATCFIRLKYSPCCSGRQYPQEGITPIWELRADFISYNS